MEPVELLQAILVGAAFGIVYAVYGILTKRDPGEPINPRKAVRSVVLWGAAGIIVSVRRGTTLTEGNIETVVTEVAFIGIAFDMAWAGLRRHGYLDWVPGVNAGG